MSVAAVAGAAANQNRIVNAVKAFGTVVTVEPEEFAKIVSMEPAPLIAVAEGGVFKTHYRYLTSCKGLAFYTKSPTPLALPPGAILIAAESITVPD